MDRRRFKISMILSVLLSSPLETVVVMRGFGNQSDATAGFWVCSCFFMCEAVPSTLYAMHHRFLFLINMVFVQLPWIFINFINFKINNYISLNNPNTTSFMSWKYSRISFMSWKYSRIVPLIRLITYWLI